MVSAWLIIVTIVAAVLMLLINIYMFIIYSHPDDLKDCSGWVAKIIIISGSALAWALILLLPLDVANSRGDGGGFNMELFYQILFIVHFAFIVFILPMMLFYYESDDEKPFMSRLCYSFCLEIAVIIITVILTIIAYFGLRKVQLADYQVVSYTDFIPSEISIGEVSQSSWSEGVQVDLPGFVFVIVFLIFVGWFFFVLFGGIGLVALPMDMIIDYFYRPRPRGPREMAERKVVIRRRVEELLTYAKSLESQIDESDEHTGFFSKWKHGRKVRNRESKLQAELYKLEQEYEIFEAEDKLKANPIVMALYLVLGILSALVSFMIWLHILLYSVIFINGQPVSEFLNRIFIFLEFKLARFISTIVFAALCVYILLCVIKGNVKFGLRLFFIIKIHPMKMGRTFMNSFLFNLIFVLLCVPAVMHFILVMFQNYMRLSSAAFLFTGLLQKMKFFEFFWEHKVFIYIFLGWTVLTFLYLLCKPKSDRLDIKKMIERRKKV